MGKSNNDVKFESKKAKKAERESIKTPKSEKKHKLAEVDSEPEQDVKMVDTTGMSARQMKKARKEAQRVAGGDVAPTDDSMKDENHSDLTSTSKSNHVNQLDAHKDFTSSIPDTSGLSAREAKRIKKAARRAELEAAAALEATAKPNIQKVVVTPQKSTKSTADREQAAYKRQMNKNLPTRQEKARRDAQRDIQKYVAELRANGITDPKEIKKMKLKYKKKLATDKSRNGYSRRH